MYNLIQNERTLRHKKRKHENGFRVYNHTCNQCDKTFTQSGSLKRHILSTHDSKKFKSDKEFSCSDSVNRHQKSEHKGLKVEHCVSSNEEKIKEPNLSESKVKRKPPKMSSRPKNGMWIIKLERLTFPGM